MAIQQEFTSRITLANHEWTWQFLHDLETFLLSDGFSVGRVSFETRAKKAQADSTLELAAIQPDPLAHVSFSMSVRNEVRGLQASISSLIVQEYPDPHLLAYISGSDETQVLGFGERLQRWKESWTPPDTSTAETPTAVESPTVPPKTPLWKETWFWGVIGLAAVIVGWIFFT